MPEALLPLDQNRVIPIRDGKFTYTFHFTHIGREDWLKYFRGIDYTSRYTGKGEEVTLDVDNALTALAEERLDRVEGYAGDFMTKPDWRSKIPLRHLRPVANQLIRVAPSGTESENPFDPECIEVVLDAAWSSNLFTGLIHRFNPVTVQQKRLFFRAGATTRVIGGGRHGTTVHATRHGTLLRIYDELIHSVQGYSVGDQPLAGQDSIRLAMDSWHKVIAAEQLFAGASDPANNQEAAAA